MGKGASKMVMGRESKRIVVGLGALTICIIVVAAVMARPVEVTLVTPQGEQTVKTHGDTVEELLREQKVAWDENDRVEPGPSAKLKDGMRVEFQEIRPIKLDIGGTKTLFVPTEKRTVAEVLAEQDIALGDLDRVTPGRASLVQDYDTIRVTRVSHEIVRKVEETENERIVLDYKVVYENGTEVKRELLEKQAVKKTEGRVMALSASETVTKEGVTFTPRRVLHNVELTAYGPGLEHTGKTPDHPHYGITFTGTRAKEGHTVAVDPDVIPLGWWIYIEGFGFRRTEDTGSLVRGKRIDIYYDSDEYANRFGLKKGYTVYLIGPKSPFS